MKSETNSNHLNRRRMTSSDTLNELESLAWDELDPCCQKELENLRKNREIKAQLRNVDRSYARYDVSKKIFSDPKTFLSCYCCKQVPSSSLDYPLLAHLRSGQNLEEKPTIEMDDDSDEDFDEDDLKFVESFQQEQKVLMEERANVMNGAQSRGYGLHFDETLGHLSIMIARGENLVLHFYDESSEIDARLDLFLEKLAQQYLGTRFRRRAKAFDAIQFMKKRRICAATETTGRSEGLLAVFAKGLLVEYASVYRFGDDEQVYSNDLLTFLDNTKVLSESLNIDSTASYRQVNDDDGEADETGRYCEEDGCSKDYPHEHIGVGMGASFAGRSEKDKAAKEVLAPNTFYRI